MWDKADEHKMDEEMIAKWTKKLTELGVPEDKIDEHLLWIFKKVTFKLSKLRLMLDDIGVDESKAKEIIEKVVAKANEKDLAKIREWRDQHQENKT
jgi:Tfp pilus assembly protein FimV